MILCTGKDTNRPAYIWVKEIVSIETLGGSHPYSRVHLKNDKENHEYFLDVLENPMVISRKIKYERLDPGCETRNQT